MGLDDYLLLFRIIKSQPKFSKLRVSQSNVPFSSCPFQYTSFWINVSIILHVHQKHVSELADFGSRFGWILIFKRSSPTWKIKYKDGYKGQKARISITTKTSGSHIHSNGIVEIENTYNKWVPLDIIHVVRLQSDISWLFWLFCQRIRHD